jgi:hypothetical protein
VRFKDETAYRAAAALGNFTYIATRAQFMGQNACESFAGFAGWATLTAGSGIPFLSGAKGDIPIDNYWVKVCSASAQSELSGAVID